MGSKNTKITPHDNDNNSLGSLTNIQTIKKYDNNIINKCKIHFSNVRSISLCNQCTEIFGYTNSIIDHIDFDEILPFMFVRYLKRLYKENILENIIPRIRHIRKLPLKTINKDIVWIENITYINILSGINIYFDVSETPIICPNVPTDFKYSLSYNPTFNVVDYSDCYIIMMDVYNSTVLTNHKTPREVALLYHTLIDKILKIVYDKYYPCIQLVECVGDSIMLYSNPRYGFYCDKRIFAILQLIQEYYRSIEDIMNNYNTFMRCGVSFGECCGGVWDGKTFRLAGNIINLASRLESKTSKHHINIHEIGIPDKFKSKFSNEYLISGHLKGFENDITYYSLPIDVS